MNRRTLLRGAGATLAGVAVASEDAGAQTALTLDVVGDAATLGPDASVTGVELSLTVEWAYDLPDSATPSRVIVEIAAGRAAGSLTVVDSAESAQLFVEASGEETFDADLLAAGALDAASLAPSGGERATEVTVEARLRVAADDGAVLARETTSDEATVTVTRDSVEPSEYGEVGGSGSLSITTGSAQ